MSTLIFIAVMIVILLEVYIILKLRVWKGNQNSYYTDYRNGKFVLRVFKPEHEFQALTNIRIPQILNRGRLNEFFDWVIIELDVWKK